MSKYFTHRVKSRVVIVGGGVAALETALALGALAPEHTEVSIIAPNSEFVYRPMTVGEPFGYGVAQRYPLARIARDAGAELLTDELEWIDHETHTLHTKAGVAIRYGALVLALGAHAHARYPHALTIDDRHMQQTLRGLIRDVESDLVHSLAFVAPSPMAWPLPLYELALMIAARARDMGIALASTIATPEDGPLALFGDAVSDSVAELLREANIEMIPSAYVKVPSSGRVAIAPGDRHLRIDRVVALPELHGPPVRGVPLGVHSFIRVDPYGRVPNVEDIYAAGDATDFPIKHGGLAAQQADAVAKTVAARAGAAVTPEPFEPLIRGVLLTGHGRRYLTARITGGAGFSSALTDTPTWSPPSKIAARYLAPYLGRLDLELAADPESPLAQPSLLT